MSAGVYGIFYDRQCLYIGQSVNVVKRLKSHQSALRSKTHSSKELLKWIFENELEVSQLSFTELEAIENPTQLLLNLLEIKYFISHAPMFHGQSPSIRNDYTRMANSPEISKEIGNTISRLAALSSTGVCRVVEGRRTWDRKCLNCLNLFEAYSPTGFYCSHKCKVSYNLLTKTCEGCSTKFTAKYKKTRFCNTCKYTVHQYEINCITCDTVFSSSKSISKYCSQDCKVESYKVVNPCSSCGKDFLGFASTRCLECRESGLWSCVCADCGDSFQGSGPMSKFCSKDCGYIKNCLICSNDFKVRNENKGRTTCTKECSNVLKSPTSTRVSKDKIKELIDTGLKPRDIMAKLEISRTSYYRVLGR